MEKVDFFIIGSGTAGLTAALYGSRSALNTLVADQSKSGGQALQIYDLENYPGLFPALSGADFSQTLENQTKAFGASIKQLQVLSIDKKNGLFYINTDKGEIIAKAVLLATGAQHKTLDIPGEKELYGAGVSYCAVCDGPFFRGKEVVVIGGGDSACTEALYLSTIASHVTIIHRRNTLRCQKVTEQRIISKDNIQIMYNCIAQSINGSKNGPSAVDSITVLNTQTGKTQEIKTNAVFIFIGMEPQNRLLEILPKDEGGYIITNEKMETPIPGLYCAGDVRSKPLRQIVTAAADGAIAAHSAWEYIQNLDGEAK